MSSVAERVHGVITQWVTFGLDGEVYGIDVMQVQEVLRLTEIAPVPGAPSFVIGIVNLRGNVVTVIDGRARFGLGSKESDDLSRIIIVEVGSTVVGMLVDSVAEVVDVDSNEIDISPGRRDDGSRFVSGVHTRESGLLILVDLDQLISDVPSGGDDLF